MTYRHINGHIVTLSTTGLYVRIMMGVISYSILYFPIYPIIYSLLLFLLHLPMSNIFLPKLALNPLWQLPPLSPFPPFPSLAQPPLAPSPSLQSAPLYKLSPSRSIHRPTDPGKKKKEDPAILTSGGDGGGGVSVHGLCFHRGYPNYWRRYPNKLLERISKLLERMSKLDKDS